LSLSGVGSSASSYDADDRLSTESCDVNGNATEIGGGRTFAYDTENHLTSMNSGVVTMIYDGDCNRVLKTVNGVTTRYLVDDLNPTGYAQVVEELSGSGVVQREYTYGLQRISQNQIVSGAWTPELLRLRWLRQCAPAHHHRRSGDGHLRFRRMYFGPDCSWTYPHPDFLDPPEMAERA